MVDNPLKVLGFHPNAFKGIKDNADIASIVKAVYRAKAQIVHPDRRSGDTGPFKELSEAWAQLDYERDANQFEYWKTQFLTTRKDHKLEELREELTTSQERQQEAENCLLDFWKNFISQGENNNNQLSVFNLPPTCFLVANTLERIICLQQGVNPLFYKESSFDLEVDSKGKLTKFPVKQIRFAKEKEDKSTEGIEYLNGEWTYISGSRGKHSFKLKRTNQNGESLDGVRLIGAIDNEKFVKVSQDLKSFRLLLPYDENPGEKTKMVKDGFAWDIFRHYAKFMSPIINYGDLLVCVKNDDSIDDFRFFVTGKVNQIRKL